MSNSSTEHPDLKLHIDAHALLQLGEQLISDDAQALLELVKNSYDADAEWANIKIDSEYIPEITDPAPSSAVGLIEVEDNGVGMTYNSLRDSWLRISFSLKRQQKRDSKRSRKFGRLPIGDKGLGRLGTMRLGSHLSVETHTSATKPGWIVTFQWSDIQSGRPLELVPIKATEAPAKGKIGTVVRVFGLRDLPNWRKQKRIRELRLKLCGLISPFGAFRDFEVTLNIEGKTIPLEVITESLRETATIRFEYSWDQKILQISGRVKLTWFRKDVSSYAQFIAQDYGKKFLTTLATNKKLVTQFHVEPVARGSWFVSVGASYKREELDFDQDHAEDPGPFKGSLDYFDLGGLTDLPTQIFDKRSDYQALVKELAQIYIYRDGFGVGMNKDWLNLGGAWTGAKGYYSLKPNNVIGYFAISVDKNGKLEEKSDREGFVDNAAWRGFNLLANRVKKFANDSLNALGRSGVKFIKESSGEHASAEDSEKNYSELVTKLEEVLKTSQSLENYLKHSSEDRRNALFKIGGAARMIWADIKRIQGAQRRSQKTP